MKLPDPFYLRTKEPKNILQFAAGQLQGNRPKQEDYFFNFNDECFVIADGVGGTPHGDVASKLAAEAAIWAYKLVRQRPYYWGEKKRLVYRIFRTSNLTVWQKQKETGFEDGLATTLSVVIAGERNFWIGHVGDSSIWLFRNGDLTKLTVDDVDSRGALTKVLGTMRYGLTPQIGSYIFEDGDVLLLLTDGITHALAPETIRSLLATMVVTSQTPDSFVSILLKKAEKANILDNMTAVVLRRIPTKK